MGVIAKTYALFSTIPFVSYFLFYYLLILFGKKKEIAKNWSIYITSVLLYSAVTAQLKIMLSLSSGYIFTLTWVVLIIALIVFLQLRLKGSINYSKLLSSTSKLSFLSFGVFYIIFLIIGLF